MKKSAATLLSEERFWEIVAHSDKGKELEAELAKLTEDELFGFRYWWLRFSYQSYNQALWAVAYTVLGGCSDDSFDYFRNWLIARGKTVYYNAVRNADSLCDEFDDLTDKEYPEWEDVEYVPQEVFERKFKKDFHETEKTYDFNLEGFPDIEFEWQEDDEESIRKVCPKTFSKWWNNDTF